MSLEMWITLICGLIIGAVAATIFDRLRWGSGTLRIDRTNPDAPKYRFDIDNLASLGKRKKFLLIVDNKADLSDKTTQK